MGLVAFVFVVVPWMALAVWLLRPAGVVRLGTPVASLRVLTDYPDPPHDHEGMSGPLLDCGI